MKKEGKLPIMELFGPTIQGEGLMSGTVTHFLRTGGCGLRCTWCDSMFAVDPKLIRKHRTMMTTNEIITTVSSMPHAPYLTLTGGDPCLHNRLGEIIYPLNGAGIRIAVETQGDLFPDWLKHCDVVTFSPKPPSSGNESDFRSIYEWIHSEFQGGIRRPIRICIKVVIFDEADFEYAMRCYEYFPAYMYDSFYFTAGTILKEEIQEELDTTVPEAPEEYMAHARTAYVLRNFKAVAELMLGHSEQLNTKVHIGCQQHVLLWPDQDKGV